jgi:hypothetical protein
LLYHKLFAERPELMGQRCTPGLHPEPGFPPAAESIPVVDHTPAGHIPAAGDNKPAAEKHSQVAELAAGH